MLRLSFKSDQNSVTIEELGRLLLLLAATVVLAIGIYISIDGIQKYRIARQEIIINTKLDELLDVMDEDG
ncbi:MAG: hypothetical protein GPJ54_13420 [Candidatus Heimdallarchaeota archaeon]|nr:hypothetical protein [Candidatus Heimdallarchaeota archaeon]